MKTKDLQKLFLVLGFGFAIFAGILSFLKDTAVAYDTRNELPWGNGDGIDIAADGGAAGFAILAGLCFVALAITTLKSEN